MADQDDFLADMDQAEERQKIGRRANTLRRAGALEEWEVLLFRDWAGVYQPECNQLLYAISRDSGVPA